MKSYELHSYIYRMTTAEDGPGLYVHLYNGSELVDISGPWSDEYDAEMARRRAEEMAS